MQIYDINLDQTKKETTQHGTMDYPIAIYTTQISKNVLGFIDWHWHKELQFCIVTKGVVSFHVNKAEIIVSQNQGIFINSSQLHQAMNYQDYDSSYICLDVHPDFISSFPGSLINDKYINPYVQNNALEYCFLSNDIDWQKDILDNLLLIYQEYENNDEEFIILIQLLTIWNLFIKNYFSTYQTTYRKDYNIRIKQMIEYITNHYHENILLDDLAKEIGISKSTCCREFKDHMDCTIFEYIMNYRLIEATKLLLSSDYNITEIAYMCGFSTSSYFIKQFKNKTGVSPYVYRKEKQNNTKEILDTMNI
ncbi:MAG: AraC family transcriptional regulator [Erysipelotrichaceae bacterium]|nr:AraC family transcriptional regulator [Erysipelotrichaceae bacterium]